MIPDKHDFKIDFIGIGSPKCGTEWLVKCLREHPQIDFSRHKEPNFFLSPQGGLNKYFYNETRIDSWCEYQKEFTHEPNKKRGEFSIKYLFDKPALIKVKECFPDIKVIISLRNPVDFLYSNYWYMKNSNFFHLIPETFEKALETSVPGDPYFMEYAFFSKYIEFVFETFGKNNTHIILLDEIRNDPAKVIKNLYTFIGVDERFIPKNLNTKVNDSVNIRFTSLSKPIFFILTTLAKLGFKNLINRIMHSDNITKIIFRKTFFTQKKYPSISSITKKDLTKTFNGDIIKLINLTGKDLSRWIKID